MSLRPVLRLSGYTALALLLLSLLLLLTLGYLVHSPSGTRWLFEQAGELAPGELQVDRLQGSLSGPLQIEGLRYRQHDLALELAHFRFDWRPLGLLDLQLHILELSLEGTRLQLPGAEPEPQPPASFPGVQLPLAIDLDALEVSDFRLIDPHGNESVRIDHIALRAHTGEAGTLRLERLQAQAFSTELELAGSLRLTPDLPLDLQLDWRFQPTDGPQLSGGGGVSGDLNELRVQQSIAPPFESTLQASLFELLKTPRWQAQLQLQEAAIGAFTASFPARLSGTLESSGTPQDSRASARLELNEPRLGELTARLQTAFSRGTLNIEQLSLKTPAGAQATGRGEYTLDDAQGTLAADLRWNELRWPLQGEPLQFRSDEGQLRLEGSPEAYQYRLSMAVSQPELPAAQLSASGSGDLEQLAFDELSLELGDGRLLGRGSLAWSPELSWQASLQGQELDPGLFHAAFPGRLELALETEGHIQQAVFQLELQLQRLEGMLRGYPVAASGKFRLEDQILSIRSLQILSGENEVQLDGRAGEQLALEWSIDAPRLAAFWPDLEGDLEATGHLDGKRGAPRIRADIDAGRVAFQDHRIENLHAVTDIDLAGGQQLDLQLEAEQLQSAGMTWQRLQLQLDGTRDAHQLELALQGRDVPQTSLTIDAGLSRDNLWSGTLRQLQLELPGLERWRLTGPSDFVLGARQQQLARTCLASAQGDVCGSFSAKDETSWRAELQAGDLALAMLQPWLPEQTRIGGRAELQAAFSADAQGRILGTADLNLPQGEFVFDVDGEPQKLDFSGALMQTRFDAQGGRGELKIPLAGLGGVEGRARLPGLRLAELRMEQQPLEGRLSARIEDLGLVSVIAPNLKNVAGRIEADFTLDGRLAQPRIKGDAELAGGALDIPAAGLELRELVLRARANDLESLTLEGAVKSGKGHLTLQGETRLLPARGFPTELQIQGENWLAVNIPEAEFRVSPDLQVKYDAQRSELNGEVVIPYARIRPRKAPQSAVTGTADLVVVGEDKQPKQQPDPKFHSRLRIILGDRVSFEGMGLRADLTGNLLVIDEPGRPVIGRGRIGISEGTYSAYGQNLKIERGYALFADSPVDNPGLDVRAVREVEDVTAGVRINGTLKNPKLAVFSEPAMTETAALSYLLTGRPPGETSGENLSVAAALRATGAGTLTSEIGRQLGLEELRVETGSTMEEASVVAGTYLSPRLYVQYMNELATSETKLRLRYDLTERFQIQTESGTSQGVDFFYTIER